MTDSNRSPRRRRSSTASSANCSTRFGSPTRRNGPVRLPAHPSVRGQIRAALGAQQTAYYLAFYSAAIAMVCFVTPRLPPDQVASATKRRSCVRRTEWCWQASRASPLPSSPRCCWSPSSSFPNRCLRRRGGGRCARARAVVRSTVSRRLRGRGTRSPEVRNRWGAVRSSD